MNGVANKSPPHRSILFILTPNEAVEKPNPHNSRLFLISNYATMCAILPTAKMIEKILRFWLFKQQEYIFARLAITGGILRRHRPIIHPFFYIVHQAV